MREAIGIAQLPRLGRLASFLQVPQFLTDKHFVSRLQADKVRRAGMIPTLSSSFEE